MYLRDFGDEEFFIRDAKLTFLRWIVSSNIRSAQTLRIILVTGNIRPQRTSFLKALQRYPN